MPEPEMKSAGSDQKNVSRRNFLKISCGVVAGAALACSGLGYIATREPAIHFQNSSCGEETNMNSKILIAYASRCGSTAEIAQAIGKTLCAQNIRVDVRPVKEAGDVSGYQSVILGSAVRYGRTLSDMTKFLETNQAALNTIPTAFFAVYLMNRGDDETSRTARRAYLDPVRKLVTPKLEAYFTGVTDYSKMSWFERMLSKALKSPEEDLRDWNAIDTWAGSLSQSGFGAAV
jgi:menaquinone-dependent protoporphyrinogen oxidase